MSLPEEKKKRLDISLYLTYMTTKDTIEWEKCPDKGYLYEAEYMGWSLRISKESQNNFRKTYYLEIQKRGSDLTPKISEDEVSSVKDVVYSIENQLGLRGKEVEEELNDFRNMLSNECERDFI